MKIKNPKLLLAKKHVDEIFLAAERSGDTASVDCLVNVIGALQPVLARKKKKKVAKSDNRKK